MKGALKVSRQCDRGLTLLESLCRSWEEEGEDSGCGQLSGLSRAARERQGAMETPTASWVWRPGVPQRAALVSALILHPRKLEAEEEIMRIFSNEIAHIS